MIHWDAPGYVVAFTTRRGGVSDGVYDSLNLTAGTGDDPARVAENRRIACAELGLDGERLSFNKQVHSTTVHRAVSRGQQADGLWTDAPGEPLLAIAADCLPIAIARTGGERALAVLHAGWRGLADGIVDAGVGALGAGEKAAVIGPAIGPCCYEVGEEVSALFDDDLTVERKLDLWSAAERALQRAGVAKVERVDMCTRCHPDLFFSHRRSGRERFARVQEQVGPNVTIVAATKYVALADMAALVEAGVTVVGENRAQDLEEKHAQYGDAFRWHFIGHLQSNKVKVVNRICELVHSLDSDSAARRLEVPALLQVNLAGEQSKSGIAPAEIASYLGYDVRGLSTMPPAAPTAEESRPWFAKLRGLAAEHGLSELSMGTTQDFAVAAEEGATYVRVGSVLFRD